MNDVVYVPIDGGNGWLVVMAYYLVGAIILMSMYRRRK